MIVGPSNAGKTRLTSRALKRWIEDEGTDGVVVLDFAPVFERNGTILGGRLDRFISIPDGVWTGRLESHAPRAESETSSDALALAKANAERARKLIDEAPDDPHAVFVNDATIARQHRFDSPHRILEYCDRAEVAVLNAFESEELGVSGPVSQVEEQTREALIRWGDRTLTLD